ncbi:hypothetical protein QAD02_020313 [Eretmocerus hayati]|uniref:Uncharacterized protein n=1 Tax=Eretmocerus hayati TaxID=131215 RepID=A0ACC2PNZ2_9HYME|nr:hypothetical protein QAD02_020313 [Eretmocerus hayati]
MRLRAALENNSLHQHQAQSALDDSADASSPSSERMIQELRDELTNLHSRLVLQEDLGNKYSELKAENKKLARELELAKQETETHGAIDAAIVDELRGKLRVGQREVEQRPDTMVELRMYVIEGWISRRSCELKRVRKELAELADGVDGRLEKFTESNKMRNEVKELVPQVNDQNEYLKMQYETLANRLQIVEKLKDMLEQQIGSNDMQVMKKFTTETRQASSESNLKMQVKD